MHVGMRVLCALKIYHLSNTAFNPIPDTIIYNNM